MKHSIGVVTLSGLFNYGNRLQAYASTAIYRKLGFNCSLLEIEDRPNFIRDSKAFVKKLLGRKVEDPEEGMSFARRSAFVRFNDNIVIETVKDTADLASRFSCFSVGSDQTWNPLYFAYMEDWFFLTFARPEQRIALAPSIGLDTLEPKQARRISKGVYGFHSLSVREKRGAELIKKCSGRDAVVVCDPTLALPAEEWRAVANNSLTPRESYVFTYLLGGAGFEATNILKKSLMADVFPLSRYLTARSLVSQMPDRPSSSRLLTTHRTWLRIRFMLPSSAPFSRHRLPSCIARVERVCLAALSSCLRCSVSRRRSTVHRVTIFLSRATTMGCLRLSIANEISL